MSVWANYVKAVTEPESHAQKEIAARAGVVQSTVGRWIRGSYTPDDAAVVAKFAESYGRNPVEAWVAAGVLTVEAAGVALTKSDLAFLEECGLSSHFPTQRSKPKGAKKPR